MLRIAICDDQPMALSSISAYIEAYLSLHRLEAEIHAFNHPDQLMRVIETELFQIYILDIVMPMVTGLELGKEIRRRSRDAQIIYATTEPQFALQAYAASPLNYLVKPIDKEKLFDTLSFAIAKVDLTEEKTFAVKASDSIRAIKFSEIMYCEYSNHVVSVHLSSGEVVSSRTIRERFTEYCRAILSDRHFLQCHTAYIVNVRRVERFAKDSFTLYGGKIIPIAAKQYPAVRDAYMDYLMLKGGSR